MKQFVRLFWSLSLALACVSLPALASQQSKPVPPQPSPLSRAADEFKILTRDQGMRPDSPPAALKQRRKMLWHGRIYENFRNDVLDAIPHEVKQNGETVSPLRRNQFGFNVAGPVLIPHLLKNPKGTFFTISYEGVREHIFRASLHTIPTATQRTGDFSSTVDPAGNLLPIYDPETTSVNSAYDSTQPLTTSNAPYLRSTFQGNVIPTNRLAPVVQQALTLYPLPNTDIGPFFQNNYFVNAPEIDTADGIIAKLEHQFHDRHRVTWNSTLSDGFLSSAKYFPDIASPTAPEQHYGTRRTELGYVFTVSSKTVNSASLIAVSDTSRAGSGTGNPFPVYQFLSSYLSMGAAYPNTHNARNTFVGSDSISTRKGKHSFGMSAEGDFYQVNSYNPAFPVGYFQFSSDITSLPGVVDTGDPFASFLLGQSAYAERIIVTGPSYFRNSYEGISGRDRYQVRKDMAVSFNLNLSRRTPRVEKYDHQSTIYPNAIDPSNGMPGALVFAGTNGMSRGMRPANYDLDPSGGGSWTPHGGKTVFRASGSRSHGQIPIYNGQWGTQGFNATQTFVSPNTQLSPAVDLSQGIPAYTAPLPDLNPSAADNTVADYVDLRGREPVYQSASLSVEREIPFSLLVSTGANYSGGHDLLVGDGTVNPNAIDPKNLSYGDQLYDLAFRETLQPYPQFQGFELYGHYAWGRYRRLSEFLRVEKRASFGLTFTAYYEHSRQCDNYSGPYGNQDLFNWRNDWSPTAYNTPQYLSLSYIYELPFGNGEPPLRFLGWGRPLVKGWSVSGTAYWNDGTPLAMHPEYNNTGGVLPTLNVDVVPGVNPHVAHPGPALWYNPAAFDQPADFTPGNGPRTEPDLRGPGYNTMDLSVTKRMPLGGERSFELSATAIDVLNHANWNYPDPNIGPASAPNVDAGRIIGSHGGRVVQIGLKFSF
jgi:hypothetical protein